MMQVEQDLVVLQQQENHPGGIERSLQSDKKQRQDRRERKRQRQDANQENSVARSPRVARGNSADQIGKADASHQDQQQVARSDALITARGNQDYRRQPGPDRRNGRGVSFAPVL